MTQNQRPEPECGCGHSWLDHRFAFDGGRFCNRSIHDPPYGCLKCEDFYAAMIQATGSTTSEAARSPGLIARAGGRSVESRDVYPANEEER